MLTGEKNPWKGLEWEFLDLLVLVASEGVQEHVLAATSRAATVPSVTGAPQHSPGLFLCARLGHRDAHPSLERAGPDPTLEHPTVPGESPLPISLGAGSHCSRDSHPFPKRSQLGALINPPVLQVK